MVPVQLFASLFRLEFPQPADLPTGVAEGVRQGVPARCDFSGDTVVGRYSVGLTGRLVSAVSDGGRPMNLAFKVAVALVPRVERDFLPTPQGICP